MNLSDRVANERDEPGHDDASLRIGVLVPLTRPGWIDAGRHLLTGIELAAREINESGGVRGRPIELLVRDTAASPITAVQAVHDLIAQGVSALAGEYHSVVAREIAATAQDLRVPYLCSSAVIDALVDQPTRRLGGTCDTYVARLAPPQSKGWTIYADYLMKAGHRRIAVVSEPSAYWTSGIGILQERCAAREVTVSVLEARSLSPADVCDELVTIEATALLLLVGHPEPAVPLVQNVRQDGRLTDLLIGAPAGQPEQPEWDRLLGRRGACIPFLRYMPDEMTQRGARVHTSLSARLSAPPSFVAFEGYDTIVVLAAAFESSDQRGRGIDWKQVTAEGTRGDIRFSPVAGGSLWQWTDAPIQVVDRDPADTERFRILAAATVQDRAPL